MIPFTRVIVVQEANRVSKDPQAERYVCVNKLIKVIPRSTLVPEILIKLLCSVEIPLNFGDVYSFTCWYGIIPADRATPIAVIFLETTFGKLLLQLLLYDVRCVSF